MKLGDTFIEDTYAEAFSMRFARVIVTAHDDYWVETAVREFSGYGTSIIGCDAEVGCERTLSPDETPDGRPGRAVLLFGMSTESLGKAVAKRTGQCLMTCATTAVFDGLVDATDRLPLGSFIRFFGDGFQRCKIVGGRKYWRIPASDGEFVVEDSIGTKKGVAGGNLIIQAVNLSVGLSAARRAADALRELPGVVTPFPGGIVRSGSKVGSRYKKLVASTNEAYCPDLRGRVPSQLHPDANCAYEIVIDGESEAAVKSAMGLAAKAAVGSGVLLIGAANYGGNLGKYHLSLREVVG